ncbi:MAG: AIR synthase-related protein, partial [Syntrophus sp. (in: bacteria)]
LARKIVFEIASLDIQAHPAVLECSIGEEMLKPTRIYVKPLLNIIKNFHIKGLVHITGGGFLDNIPRIVPLSCKAVIYADSWFIPPIFTLLKGLGNVDEIEMLRVFNMGVGMMMIASEKDVTEIMDRLEKLGEKPYCIGHIEKRDSEEPPVIFTYS